MFKRTKSFSKQAKKLLKSKKGFFVDTGVKILISVVLGALVLGGLYAVFNNTIMSSVTSKVESMFDYSDGTSKINDEPSMEEKYMLDTSDVYYNETESMLFGCYVEVNKLNEIQIDGEALKTCDYHFNDDGYTYFNLLEQKIKTLSIGNHTMRVIFNDGYAEGKFRVLKPIAIYLGEGYKIYAFQGFTFEEWMKFEEVDIGTNGILWQIDGDDRVYVDENHTKYLVGQTWQSVIEEEKTYTVTTK